MDGSWNGMELIMGYRDSSPQRKEQTPLYVSDPTTLFVLSHKVTVAEVSVVAKRR